MLKFFITSTMFMAFAISWGQESTVFSGKVMDEFLQPIMGATIVIEKTRKGAISDEEGNFSITMQDPGTYRYSISFIGYQKALGQIEIVVGQTSELIVSLKESTVKMDELIVSAFKAGKSSPFAHSNIGKAELKSKNVSSDLPTLLESLPSIVATSENGTGFGYSSFRIRGTDISRINITMNGVPLNDSESQGVYFVNMPDFASSVDNIQVQRGVGTSSNGAAAFGGSVNFSTIGLNKAPYAELQTMVGSFNTVKNSVMAGTGQLSNGFNFDVRYSNLNSDGYVNRGFSDHESMFLSAGWRDEKTLVKGMAIIGKQKTGITWWGVPDYLISTDRRYNPAGKFIDNSGEDAFYEGQTDNYWQNHYQLLVSHSVTDHLDINAALHTTKGEGYYEQYVPIIDDFGDANNYGNYGLANVVIGDSILSATDMIRQKWLDNTFYGANASINYHSSNLRTSGGVAYNKYVGDHFGLIKWVKEGGVPADTEWYRNTGTKQDFSVFIKADYLLTDGLWAFADVQYRNLKYDMEGPDDDLILLDQSHNWNFVNPKAGLSYQMNKVRLYGSFAIANREPARADLKDATKEGGKDIPTPETLYDYEAGAIWTTNKVVVSGNAYYMSYKDQLVNTGQLNSVGYAIMTNVDESYRMGFELVYKFILNDWLSYEANATLSRNKIKNYIEYATAYDDNWDKFIQRKELGETDISYSPSYVGGADVTLAPLDNVKLHIIYKTVGKQFFDNTSNKDRTLDAYQFVNLRLDLGQFHIFGAKLEMQFLYNNLFNTLYSSNAYGGNWYEQGKEESWAYYFPQAGSNYAVKAVIKF